MAPYVSSHLTSEFILPHLDPKLYECLFVEVNLHENKYVTIGNVFRLPSAPPGPSSCLN